MKKVIGVLLALSLCFAVGCGNNEEEVSSMASEPEVSSVESLPESSVPSEPPVETWVIVNVDPDSYVNVRSGPGLEEQIIGQALLGETYEISQEGSTEEWIQIDYKGAVGYVFHDYISAETAA